MNCQPEDLDNNLSVLIPVYNNKIGLLKSLESIRESFNLIVYIFDDGSDEPIKLQLDKYPFSIHIIRSKSNVGIVNGLNSLLDLVKMKPTRYIARLDAGDICLPDRFLKQIIHLKLNELDFNFSSLWDVDTEKNIIKQIGKKFESIHSFKKSMKSRNVGYHPAFMAKYETICSERYNQNFEKCEDYEYFIRLIHKNLNGCYCSHTGLIYNRTSDSISQKHNIKQKWLKFLISHKFYGIRYSYIPLISLFITLILPWNAQRFIKKIM